MRTILNLMRDFTLNGVAHITGGGFPGNVPRVLPKGVQARIDPSRWPRPPIFDWLQRRGGIDDAEMLRVFNCGIGMVLIVPVGSRRATSSTASRRSASARIGSARSTCASPTTRRSTLGPLAG